MNFCPLVEWFHKKVALIASLAEYITVSLI